ncbi:MAG: SAM-dependent methyltransferase [Lachnospiraceae bacterium]|nr:SAM-dependent methyltransferase [Lachnospiraceae bacterium]
MIQLSRRLQAVADLITQEGVLADIGTDHGYIPIYLIQNGRIKKAIAADIKEGPLFRAKEHIERYGLSDYIEIRLSDGAKNIRSGEADVFVLAGMGGGLMYRILSQSRLVFEGAKEIILQPQSEQEQLRRNLIGDGWKILEEDMVEEDGKYYPMMRISMYFSEKVRQKNLYEDAKDIEYLYGAYLLDGKHPILKEFLKKQGELYQNLLKELSALPENPGVKKRIAQIERKADLTKEAVEKTER